MATTTERPDASALAQPDALAVNASSPAHTWLALLADAAGRLLVAHDARAMIHEVFELIAAPMRLDVFFNYRLTESDELMLAAHAGISDAMAHAGQTLSLGQAVCGCVARDRLPAHATDIQASDDPQVAFIKAAGLTAYACTPMLVGDRLLGTLGFGRRGETAFTDDELSFLRTIATYVAMATERLRVETALAESENWFRTIAETLPQLVWSTLPDGYNDYFNSRWYEFTGLRQGESDGEAWSDTLHPDDQGIAWERWNHSLSTGEPYQIEYRLRHHSGEYRWVLGRATPVRNTAGDIVRWMGTCTDIQEMVEAHGMAKDTVVLMHDRLYQDTRASSLSSLSSAIAHELNQPLATAANSIAAASLRLKNGGDAARVSQNLDEAMDAVFLASDVLRRLRDLIERRPHKPAVVSVREVVASLLPVIRNLNSAAQLVIAIDSEAELCFADGVQIKQVLLNLIRNAATALEGHSEPRIEVAARPYDERFNLVSVTDNGPGVATAAMQRLFEPFNATTDSGLGIGLSICKTVIEQNGGKIWLAQARTGGAQFCFTVPRPSTQ